MKKRIAESDLLKQLAEKSLDIDDILQLAFRQLRCHQSYWQEVRRDLRAQLIYFGSPTWFVTLNPAESSWVELLEAYRLIYPHLNKSAQEFCIFDPEVFVRHFTQRVNSVFKELLYVQNGILGPVIHHWRRLEYQSRGSTHAHCLLWVKGAPKIGFSEEEEITNFIDKFITCRNPDTDMEPILGDLVRRFQMHKQPCTKTCATTVKVRNKKITSCRFGYPQPVAPFTRLLHHEASADPLRRVRKYELKRDVNEQFVNSYNPALLIAWKGNVDVQFVGSTDGKQVDYLTAYTGKAEGKNVTDIFQNSSTQLQKSDVLRMGLAFLQHREAGEPEMVDRLLGHSLHESDMAVRFLPTNENDQRMRRLKRLNEINDGDRMTAQNLLDDYYPKRHLCLEKFCLFNIATYMTIERAGNARGDLIDNRDIGSEPFQSSINKLGLDGWDTSSIDSPFYYHKPGVLFPIEGTNKFMKSRVKPLLLRCYWPDPSIGLKEAEDYCRRVLMLFKPWRKESELLEGHDSYSESLEQFRLQQSNNVCDQMDRYLDGVLEMLNTLSDRRKEREERQRLMAELEIEEIDGCEYIAREVTEELCKEQESGLNDGQQDIFQKVLSAVASYHDTAVSSEFTQDNCKPLRLFVSGVGGTGKSTLIKALADAVTLRYGQSGCNSPPCLLAAPTGLAALAIKGATLHSLLKIEVESTGLKKYEALPPRACQELAVLFRNCRLLIIDEISMVSNVMLAKICLRLMEIKKSSEAFGGLNVVVFGDLLQLPPVRAENVFDMLSRKHIRMFFASAGLDLNLWEHFFEYAELTENMRQKGDSEYSKLLDRIRIGSPNDDDLDSLAKRMISYSDSILTMPPPPSSLENAVKHFLHLRENVDPGVVALFPRISDVEKFNDLVMERTAVLNHQSIIEIHATDKYETTTSMKKSWTRKYQEKGYTRKDMGKLRSRIMAKQRKISLHTKAALPSILRLSIGCRVMLRRNVDITRGLVNGAMGVLTEVLTNQNEIHGLGVKFDNGERTIIDKITAKFDVSANLRATRTQFPVIPAYALTVHKSQGLTLKTVLADISECFSAGMVYVTLSRVTNLSGLHLIDFDPGKIRANIRAVKEYDRLRTSCGLQKLPTPNIPPASASRFCRSKPKYYKGSTVLHQNDPETTSQFQTALGNSELKPVNVQNKGTQLTPLISINEGIHVKIRNERNNCFMNSVLAVLFSHPVAEFIVNSERQNDVSLEFDRLLKNSGKGPISSIGLLDAVGRNIARGIINNNIDNGDQHDPAEFYRYFVEYLPQCLKTRFLLRCDWKTKCDICELTVNQNEYELCVVDVPHIPSCPFTELLEKVHKTKMDMICEECERRQNDVDAVVTYYSQNSSVLAFELPAATLDRNNVPIRAAPHFNGNFLTIEFAGIQWKLCGIVRHIPFDFGDKIQRGHYIAYAEQNGDWFMFDDVALRKKKLSAPPTTIKDARIIFYKRDL